LPVQTESVAVQVPVAQRPQLLPPAPQVVPSFLFCVQPPLPLQLRQSEQETPAATKSQAPEPLQLPVPQPASGVHSLFVSMLAVSLTQAPFWQTWQRGQSPWSVELG